jgi:cyanophycinase-like exopeptidase
MKLILSNPTEVVVVKEVKKTVEEVTVVEVVDNSEAKSVKAFTQEFGIIYLWEGDAYDAIGQWTDTDVLNRISEILNS